VKRTLVVVILLTLCPSASLARPHKGQISWFKVVGRVLDGNGRPIHWGRVYVRDTNAHFLRIKPVDHGGHFNVVGLDARLDYVVYAEQDDLTSGKILVSGPKKTPKVIITLRLQKKEETH
jgi:hypothetical protein